MENKYRKYYYERDVEWHENIIGTYHVSAIGNSHKDLNPYDHSGPCLRETFFRYTDPIENDDKTEGNFHIGKILHSIIQDIYKHNIPNSIIEFPIVFNLTEDIKIKGSVDIIDFDEKKIIDLKSVSLFTFPSSEYEYRPTHMTQVSIYSAILSLYVFKETFFNPTDLRIVYTKKHNLETGEQDMGIDEEDVMISYGDFVCRVVYLDTCLKDKEVPKAEPHKWCKFCSLLDYCKEHGDIKELKKKGRYILNETL